VESSWVHSARRPMNGLRNRENMEEKNCAFFSNFSYATRDSVVGISTG
jgi:hypothetical protein